MRTKVKVGLMVGSVAVFAAVILLAPVLRDLVWLKWALYVCGGLMLAPLFMGGRADGADGKAKNMRFDETNAGDAMQDVWGFNGHDRHHD